MKKIIYCCFAVIFISIFISGCKKQAKTLKYPQAKEKQAVNGYSIIPVKAEKKSSKKESDSNKIDIDFTKYNYNMASAMIFEIFMDQEKYLGKRIKIRGKFYADEDEHGQFFAVLLYDATACCQTGFSFEDNNRRYPEDYPAQLEDIEITGIYSKKYIGETEITYIDCNK